MRPATFDPKGMAYVLILRKSSTMYHLTSFRIAYALFVAGLIGGLLVTAVPLSPPNESTANTVEPLVHLTTRQDESDGKSRDMPGGLFRAQLTNPKEMMSILLLIGGDVIQRAMAQLTGPKGRWFTPVIFSFGWVTYAFSTVSNAIGDGTFLPPPDYPGLVVNIGSGDVRTNQSWVLGRLCRDLELEVERREGAAKLNTGLVVSILRANATGPYKSCHPCRDMLWWCFVPFLAAQLAFAAIPLGLHGNWSILLTTMMGNVLAIMSGSLHSMRQEKYHCHKHSNQVFALTRGNGHKHVFILLPDTFAKGKPKDEAKSKKCLIKPKEDEGKLKEDVRERPIANLPAIDMLASASHRADWGTRVLSVVMAGLWVIFLLVIGGLDTDTWYLLGAGLCGMAHNIICSGWSRSSEAHGIPLEFCKTEDKFLVFGLNYANGAPEGRQGVLKVLVKLELAYPGSGHALKGLFFTGHETERDRKMWKGNLGKNLKIHERLISQNTVVDRFAAWKKQCKDLGRVERLDPTLLGGQAQTNGNNNSGDGADKTAGLTRRNTAAMAARL